MHVVARRGHRALVVKALRNVFDMDKAEKCLDPVNVDDSVFESRLTDANQSLGLTRICAIPFFPTRIRLALSHQIDPASAARVHKHISSLVYSFITRSDGSPDQPAWSRHIPSVHHSCMALLRCSNGLGDSVIRLNELIRLKIARHAQDMNAMVHAIAELLLHLFLASALDSCENGEDAGLANSILIELLWISDVMKNAHTRLSNLEIEAIDDTFTTRASPYRGLKLSKPVWNTLNNVISDFYNRNIGIGTTCPSDETGCGILLTAGVDDFVNELCTTIISVRVFETLTSKVMQILNNFNSRYRKAVASRDASAPATFSSLQALLKNPWCDDVEIRAIAAAYKAISKIIHGRFDLSVLLGAVLGGAWRAVAQLDVIKMVVASVSQGETSVIFDCPGEAELKLNRLRLLARSYTSPQLKFTIHLKEIAGVKRDSKALIIQRWWRGERLRKIHMKNMRTLCVFIQNVGWPDVMPELFEAESDSTPITVNKNSTLTRASLMRLVPASKPRKGETRPKQRLERNSASTPTESSVGVTHAHRDPHEDFIQADHIACGQLLFILVYSLYLQRLMHRYFVSIVYTIDAVSTVFVELIMRIAQYEVAHSQTVESLKRSASQHKRAQSPQKVQHMAKVTFRPSDWNRSQITRSPAYLPFNRTRKHEVPGCRPQTTPGAKPNIAGVSVEKHTAMSKVRPLSQQRAESAHDKIVSFDDKYLSVYVRFFEGDDTLTRDISPDGVNCQSHPRASSPDTETLLSMIWLPIHAIRFSNSRARIISIIRTEVGRSLFQRGEACHDFIKCINILSDTQHGSLNILGNPASTQPLWIEHIYHLAVGYIAQFSKTNEFESGLSFILNILQALPSSLRKLNEAHQLCIEAMMYDASLGFAYQFPSQTEKYAEVWHDEAARRYIALGHRVRYVKSCIRVGCILFKQKHYERCVNKLSTAINKCVRCPDSSIMIIARLNRVIATYWSGRPEGAELEVREIAVTCKKHNELARLGDRADQLRAYLSERRRESSKARG
jgi:hypothetical protein